jgi:hypothetical protein
MLRAIVLVTVLAACGTAKPGGMGGPNINNKVGGDEVSYRSPVVSWDILDREPVANEVKVSHILIGWKDLADAYGGNLDPRAEPRSRADAEAEVKSLVAALAGGADFDKTMYDHSEDRGTLATNPVLTITPDAQYVLDFRRLSLRLQPGEVGVCQTDFGFHIIKRL